MYYDDNYLQHLLQLRREAELEYASATTQADRQYYAAWVGYYTNRIDKIQRGQHNADLY